MSEQRVNDAWAKIEALVAQSPRHRLSAPIDEARLAALRARLEGLGLELPQELAASLRRHDGANVPAKTPTAPWRPCSAGEILEQLDLAQELAADWQHMEADAPYPAETAPGWWSAKWIPVASSGGGDFLCIDLGPSASGTKGQVVSFFRDTVRQRRVEAADWAAWLESLSSPPWTYDPQFGFERA